MKGRLLRIGFASLAIALVTIAGAAEYGPVQVELRGQTQRWTEQGPVLETTDDVLYQTERYGPHFSYVLTGLPAGPARIKLGFCEFKYTERGQRVFDILANDKPLFKDFDILKVGGPREAVIVASPIDIPAGKPLTLEFAAKVENAKFNYLKVYTGDWTFEIKASDEPQVSLGPASKDASYLSEAFETCIGKFGSRININPRPQQGICRQNPLGHADYNVAYFETNPALYNDPATPVYYAVRAEGDDGRDIWYSLPFNGRLQPFTSIKQSQTLTSLTYTCRGPDLPVEVTYSFHAPFYPQDLKLCVAPYLLLDVTVRNLTSAERKGTVVVGQSLRGTDTAQAAQGKGCFGVQFNLPIFQKLTQQAWLVDQKASDGVTAHVGTLGIPAGSKAQSTAATTDADGRTQLASNWADSASGLTWDFTVAPQASSTRTFAYVGWMGGQILEVKGVPYHFKYADLFADLFDVARYGFDQRAEIDRKVALFESTVANSSAPKALRDFLAFSFQSWVQNTFYCADPEGKDWFSVWEGCCKFHSTVDVEYNVAPLYFDYWPQLMKLTLQEWTGYIRDGILSHDMGMGLQANGMKYGHDMEVEENTNFVLLLHQYWRQTGDTAALEELFPAAQTLLDHVTACDTDGDGFHEVGTYNTIDQGSAAVQYAQNQTYLAMRALCAYVCGAQMAEKLGQAAKAQEWTQKAQVTAKTLNEQAWHDDHYVVALNKQAQTQQMAAATAPEGDGDPDYGGLMEGEYNGNGGGYRGNNGGYNGNNGGYSQSYAPKPVQGWDGYSIYTTNGMLYPMRVGLQLPGLDLDRLRTDLTRATLETLKRYGSPHTNRENNMWVSQNLWRDMAAAYLGMDLSDTVQGYWDLQKYINRAKRGCFTDVYVYGNDSISLDYYPRGVAAFGLLPALAGLQVDKVSGLVSVAPVRTPLRVPLLTYADWAAEKVPWLNFEPKDGQTQVSVDGQIPVPVKLREAGQPW